MSKPSKPSTQDIERFYFEQFRKIYPLPDGQIVHDDKPDFILHADTRTIGIEMTRFYLRAGKALESEQQQTPLREEIVRSAQNIYRATGGNIELSFNFNPTVPITSARQKVLPDELANIAKHMDASATGKSAPLYPRPAIPEVANVYFTGDHYSDPHWRIFQISTLTKMSPAALENIVRKKERRSQQYKRCDAYWLLFIVDWADRAQDQEIRLEGLKIISKIFETIIVYKWGYDHLVEIQVT
jgi:hypothetical protein